MANLRIYNYISSADDRVIIEETEEQLQRMLDVILTMKENDTEWK